MFISPADITLQQKFQVASALAGGEFYSALNRAMNSWYPARSLVEEAVKTRKQHHPSGQLIVFENFAPWKVSLACTSFCICGIMLSIILEQEHLHLLEQELQIPEAEKPLYILYPEETGGKWRIQAVPVSPDSFTSRKPLPEA